MAQCYRNFAGFGKGQCIALTTENPHKQNRLVWGTPIRLRSEGQVCVGQLAMGFTQEHFLITEAGTSAKLLGARYFFTDFVEARIQDGRFVLQPILFGFRFKRLVDIPVAEIREVRPQTKYLASHLLITFGPEPLTTVVFAPARIKEWMRAFEAQGIPVQPGTVVAWPNHLRNAIGWIIVGCSILFVPLLLLLLAALLLAR